MNIVVFKVNHLGDNIVFVPAIQALRQRCPEWHLTLLTTPGAAELYMGPLGPQEVIVCPKHAFDKSYRMPWRLARWIWRIRRKRPDACLIAFDQGTAAHLVAKLSGARVRIGGNLDFIRVRRSLTEEVPIPGDTRPVTWNWQMARALAGSMGRDEGWPDEPPPPDLGHLLKKETRKPGDRKRVVVHPGSGRILNKWPLRQFASVASSLSGDYEVVWIQHGDPAGPAPGGTIPAVVASLSALAELLAGADLFLGNNSGPMHLASALGCAGVVVTGSSPFGWDPYWHRERWTVLRHPDLYCQPCEDPTKEVKSCANLANPMACLSYWTEGRVEAACRLQLGRAQ